MADYTDTYDDNWVPSGVAFDNMDPGAPDGRGYSAPSATFATGDRRVMGDQVTTRDKSGGVVTGVADIPVTETTQP